VFSLPVSSVEIDSFSLIFSASQYLCGKVSLPPFSAPPRLRVEAGSRWYSPKARELSHNGGRYVIQTCLVALCRRCRFARFSQERIVDIGVCGPVDDFSKAEQFGFDYFEPAAADVSALSDAISPLSMLACPNRESGASASTASSGPCRWWVRRSTARLSRPT